MDGTALNAAAAAAAEAAPASAGRPDQLTESLHGPCNIHFVYGRVTGRASV